MCDCRSDCCMNKIVGERMLGGVPMELTLRLQGWLQKPWTRDENHTKVCEKNWIG